MLWFPTLVGIKREYGVNPELSRSCKLLNCFSFLMSLPYKMGGKTEKTGSKSEDLPKTHKFIAFGD